MTCDKCDGCGKVADSDDEEPWSDWLKLPVESASALLLGFVKPKPCPMCNGTGETKGECMVKNAKFVLPPPENRSVDSLLECVRAIQRALFIEKGVHRDVIVSHPVWSKESHQKIEDALSRAGLQSEYLLDYFPSSE